MQRRPAADDQDAVDRAQILVAESEAVQVELAVVEALGDRVGDGGRLLVDLLQHERVVAALGGDLDRLVGQLDRVRARCPVGDGAEFDAVGRDDHDLALIDDLHRAGLLEEGGREGGDVVLALAPTDHERRPGQTGGDDPVGLVNGHREEREVALEAREQAAAGLGEVTVVFVLDQMDECLGVGVGR